MVFKEPMTDSFARTHQKDFTFVREWRRKKTCDMGNYAVANYYRLKDRKAMLSTTPEHLVYHSACSVMVGTMLKVIQRE